MARRIKIALIVLLVAILALSTACMGMTLAIWTSSTPGEGNTVAPAADSYDSWNAWAKYFDFEIINATTNEVAITAFHGNDYGLNLETVVIPQYITRAGENGEEQRYTVVEIGNQVFADATLKELPVTVRISPSVTRIASMAFANLPNLTTVEFGASDKECVIEDFAFMMSSSLASVVTNGRNVKDASGVVIDGNYDINSSLIFIGCSSDLQIVENKQ